MKRQDLFDLFVSFLISAMVIMIFVGVITALSKLGWIIGSVIFFLWVLLGLFLYTNTKKGEW